MNSLRLLAPACLLLASSSFAAPKSGAHKTVAPHKTSASNKAALHKAALHKAALHKAALHKAAATHKVVASRPATGVAGRVKLFDAFEHQWQGTGTKRTRPRFGVKNRSGFFFTSGLMIDADGSPRAFNRVSSKGLDDLQNAGHTGNWWGIMTNNGETWGKPIVQGPRDPAPGFYISPTGLEDTTKRETDPRRYVDAVRVPYLVLSGTAKQNKNARMGDYAVVLNKANGKWAYAMCGDTWDETKVGEGSIALAKQLGINADARNGGVDDGVVYLIFPGSRQKPWRAEETLAQMNASAAKALKNWGGIEQLRTLSK